MADSKDVYNPYEHRVIPRPITNFGALISVIKAVVGTGILAAPMAFRNAGWLNGVISTTIIAVIIIYSKQILLYAMYDLEVMQQVPLLTFSEAMTIASEIGPPCTNYIKRLLGDSVDIMLVIFHFGTCCVYTVFIANCTKFIFDIYWTQLDSRIIMAMYTLPLCLICLLPDLKALVPYVAFANILLLAGFGIVLYHIFTGLKPFSEMVVFQDIRYYPMYIGTTMFAFDSPGLLVSIEATMINPASYLGTFGILSVGLATVCTLQIIFSLLGYWRYTEEIKSLILLNLPENSITSTVTNVIFIFIIFISYPLQGYVPIDIVWNKHLKQKVDEKKAFAIELVFRCGMVVTSSVIAIGCPNLTTILSFVGAFAISFLGLILPATLHLCVKSVKGYGPLKIFLWIDILIIIVGFIFAVCGMWIPMDQVINSRYLHLSMHEQD